jgi:plasmid stabilization system protein ParE
VTVDVRLRPEAEQDLAESARWYEDQRPGLGQEFLDEALATFAAIAERPLASAAVYGSLRRALLHRFPFGVFYLVDGDGAVVIGVIHGSRHPRRWKSRL